MTPRMYFTLVLRGIGTWRLIEGLDDVVAAYNIHAGLYQTHVSDARSFLTHAVLSVAIGITLVMGAATISAMVVPPMQSPDRDDPEGKKANV
jgi:hypothetical protein